MAHVAIAAIAARPRPHPSIDTARAAAAPGVIGVFTGKDFERPQPAAVRLAGGRRREQRRHAARAGDRQGRLHAAPASRRWWRRRREPAEDALGADRGRLGAARRRSSTPRRPPQTGAPQIHEKAPNNIVMDWTCGDADADRRGARRRPTSVVRQRLVNQRLIPTPMETRGAVGRVRPRHRGVHGLGDARRRRTSCGC